MAVVAEAGPGSVPVGATSGTGAPARPPLPGGVAGADSPPLSLPGSHFAAATLFLLAGGVGLLLSAPQLAAGAFLSPRVTSTTHLFTLGWITTSILGALYQLLPVALGQPIRSRAVARATFALHVTGLPLFLGGLWAGTAWATMAGAVSFATGLLLFAGNLTFTLARAEKRDVTWWALAGADLFLVITVLLGSALAGNLGQGWLGGSRLLALGVHLHVALAGWVLLVMVGVAQRLLPMFLLSHGADERPARAAVGLIIAGLLVLSVGHHGPRLVAVWLPAFLVLAGAAAFLVQARAFYRARRRPRLDPGMALAAAGLGIVGVGALLAVPALAAGFGAGRLATLYGLCLVLGISVFVAAHYYKIVPFLVWYHRFGPLVGRKPVPMVADLYRADAARVAGALLTVGTVVLGASVAMASPWGARTGALLFLTGAVIEAAQMLGIAKRSPSAGTTDTSGATHG